MINSDTELLETVPNHTEVETETVTNAEQEKPDFFNDDVLRDTADSSNAPMTIAETVTYLDCDADGKNWEISR